MRTVEWRPDHRVNVVAACWASIRWHLPEFCETPMLAAFQALNLFAVAHFHKVIQARIIVGELLEKLLDSRLLAHHETSYAYKHKVRGREKDSHRHYKQYQHALEMLSDCSARVDELTGRKK